jgi:hypothetical protein
MLRKLLLTTIVTIPLAVQAQTPTTIRTISNVRQLTATELTERAQDNLSKCLADNTSSKDRNDLTRWVLFAMASHPEFKKYSSNDVASAMEDSHKLAAEIFTKLLAENCQEQTRVAEERGGAAAIGHAFKSVGQLAMQELISDSNVKTNLSAFEKYIDRSKFKKIFEPK